MSTQLNKKSVARNYAFLAVMLGSMILGSIVGWIFPEVRDANDEVISAGATVLEPLGTLFLNMMFCIVVPMVFSSIAGSVATMKSRKRAGKIMGTTVLTFIITGAIAAVIMIVIMKIFPPVLEPWSNLTEGVVDDPISIPDLIVNFFTVGDFSQLLSRSAMLPLIVFSILFGFGVNLGPGPDSLIAKFLTSLSDAMMKVVQLVTYYAPIAFFGFFANLVATYGSQIAQDYARALVVYYPLCFIYIFVAFPLFAWFGGGKGAVKEMFRHIARPAITSLGTCSSVATIPTNMEEAESTGISKDVSEIVVPLGATMHMDGSCFSCILKIVFLFGVFGRPFDSIGDMALMVVVAVLSSVGMSGVPGGGYIGEFIMCSVFFRISWQSPIPSPSPSATWWILRHHDQLLRRLCGQLRGLPVRGRQGLVPEGSGQPEFLNPRMKRKRTCPEAGPFSVSILLLDVAAFFLFCLHGPAEGRGGQAALGGLPQLHRQVAAHVAHAVDDLVYRHPALDARQGHVRRADGVHRPDDVPLHAGDLHQPRHRVAHQAHQILQGHGHGVADLLRHAAPAGPPERPPPWLRLSRSPPGSRRRRRRWTPGSRPPRRCLRPHTVPGR